MDQSTSNGTDKRNWRERLGIGTKELPRISEEFKARKEPAIAASRPAEGVAVAKPAPMAPRVAPKAAPAPKPSATPAPRPDANASGTEMADRLKAQRAAAEKLAEQRVNAARERAEAARSGDAKPTSAPASKPPPAITAPMPSLAVSKPKFSFADEDQAPPPRDFTTSFTQRPAQPPVPTQLSPPRPALGGDRTVPPAVRSPSQPAPSFQPQYRPPQPPPGFRPVDTASNMPAPPRINPRAYGETTYSPPGPERPVPARPAYEPSYRQETDASADYRPARQRPRPAARPQTNQDDDYGDVFEDDAPRNSRRASAREYNQAYRDAEDGYGDVERRSAGPWILLGLLLLAAIAAGATVWYYQTKVKTASTTAESGEVPVVAAPEQPAKTAAETPTEPVAAGTEIPAADTKKQIYDRIVGEREVLGGEMVPTEEPPVPPPVQRDQSGDTVLPANDAQPPASTDDTVPLPLPPPPGDGDASQSNTQGQLNAPIPATTNNATVEAASALPEPPPQLEAAPQVATDTAEAKPEETLEIKDGQEASEPKQAEATPPKPAKKVATKTKSKAKAKPKPVPEQDVTANEPLVLVPPAGGDAQQANAPQAAESPTPKKKKTLLDLFRRDQTGASAETQKPAQQQVASVDTDQQVGSLPAPKPAQPTIPQATSEPAGGFVAQLASFRTQAEATREWNRIKSKHGGIVGGLSPKISQAPVNGSTRYRLGVGPMANKDDASRLCDSLLAAGERDCIVRAQ